MGVERSSGGSVSIRTEGLTKYYGRHLGVEDVTFEVNSGEVVGFLGPNGSGKTTVLRMIVGLLSITRGRALLMGRDVALTGPPVRAELGYLPGTLGLYDKMTAGEYFGFLSRMRRLDCRAAAHALCDRLALDPTVRIGSMSKGTRQKVGVVQAFMHAPRLLILDEPTSGLDPLVQHEFETLLRETRERGAAVLLSSHVMSEVERLASRVAILDAGHLVAFDHVEHLPGRTHRPIVLEFEGSADPSTVAGVAGFTLTSCEGRLLCGSMVGSQRPLLEAALRADLVAVKSPEPSLDELFRGLVGSDRTAPGGGAT